LAPDQQAEGETKFGDSSWPLFSIYSKNAEEEDIKMAERWQKDADGIILFTGLFSASVAALTTVSVQDLKPDYLGNIYQVLADPNATRSSTPSVDFSPSRSAIWVNSLWFLSLAISLTCAMMATLLQQSARRYIRVTQRRYSPHRRARIRAFFADGRDELLAPMVVEALPALLHFSLFLFFSGLLIFLFDINHAAFYAVLWWVALAAALYTLTTILPIFRQDSPYYPPLSSTFWYLFYSTSYGFSNAMSFITSLDFFHDDTWERFTDLKERYHKFLRGVETTAEEEAWKRSSKMDARVLEWTIGALGEDDALEKFFEAIPGFFNSTEVEDPQLSSNATTKFSQSLDEFLDRALSNSHSESDKIRRLALCLDAAHGAQNYLVSGILQDILDGRWADAPQSVEMGHSLTRWANDGDENKALFARSIIARIVANAQKRDARWSALAKDHLAALGIPEDEFKGYLGQEDNVLLANLMRITRQTLPSVFVNQHKLQSSISTFDIKNTLPELQHDFCDFWNEIVREAQKSAPFTAYVFVLANIRHLYMALHPQGTPAAPTKFSPSTAIFDRILYLGSSYPICDIPSHRPQAKIVYHTSQAAEGETAPVASSPTITPSTRHDAPSFSALNSDHIVVHPTDEDSLPDTLQPIISVFPPPLTPPETLDSD
jgi:hypothetical protein